MKRLRYIGPKAFEAYRKLGVNKVWVGHGDVHPIDDDDTAVLMAQRYPSIFELVSDDPELVQAASGQTYGAAPVGEPEGESGEPPPAEPDGKQEVTDRILATEMIPDGAGGTVALKDASYNDIREYASDTLHMRYGRSPKRDKLVDDIVELRLTQAAARAAARHEG